MATTIESPPAVATGASPFVFGDVTWDDYEAMLRIVGDRPIRVIYDQGDMEIMSPGFLHDRLGYLLGRIVDLVCVGLDIPFEAGRTTTLKRADLGKAAEADESFWFREKAQRMFQKTRLDLAVDPAPDLVIEVDITSSSVSRMKIFSAMGIPEVWCHDGQTLQFFHLGQDGVYHPENASRNLTGLSVADTIEFLKQAEQAERLAWTKVVSAYVRDVIVPRLGDRV